MIYITVGMACSGKLEWATRMVEITGGLLSCRDLMRPAVTGKSLSRYRVEPKVENLISELRDFQIEYCRDEGLDMFIADTNLNIEHLKALLNECRLLEVDVTIVEFRPQFTKAINANRRRSMEAPTRGYKIPEGVLKRQFDNFYANFVPFASGELLGMMNEFKGKLHYCSDPTGLLHASEMKSIARNIEAAGGGDVIIYKMRQAVENATSEVK